MDIIFCGVDTVTMTDAGVIKNAYVGVKDGKIAYIGEKEPEGGQGCRRISGKNKVLMPGIVNTHTHIPMTVLRGYADDYALAEWLNDHIFPAEDRLDDDTVSISAQLAIAEMIATGTTSFSDGYYFCDSICDAVAKSGIKANISRSVTNFNHDIKLMDFKGTREQVELTEKWHMYENGRLRTDASIHAEYTTSESLWRELGEYAQENNLIMQLHLSETQSEHDSCIKKYGKTPAQIFCDAGVFDGKALAAHCVWVTDEDIEILKEKRVSVAHNPVSNLKLASGVARVPYMLEQGVNVGIGTDGVASNNSFDMFEEIKLTAILHKASCFDPKVIPAEQALKMATVNGAVAQGRECECGRLEVGMDADMVLVDFDKPHLTPCHNTISNLVYACRGSDVYMTMVRGKILYENREFKTLDWGKIKRRMGEYAVPKICGLI